MQSGCETQTGETTHPLILGLPTNLSTCGESDLPTSITCGRTHYSLRLDLVRTEVIVPLKVFLTYRVVARVLVLTFPNAPQPRLVEFVCVRTVNDLIFISDEANSLTLKRLGVEVDQITQIPKTSLIDMRSACVSHLLFPSLKCINVSHFVLLWGVRGSPYRREELLKWTLFNATPTFM